MGNARSGIRWWCWHRGDVGVRDCLSKTFCLKRGREMGKNRRVGGARRESENGDGVGVSLEFWSV